VTKNKVQDLKKKLTGPLNQDLIDDLRDALANHDPDDVPDLPVLDLDDRDVFDVLAVALGPPSTD